VPSISSPKPASYYNQARDEVVSRARRPVGAVLDVGCGGGASEAALRAVGATEITGVEIEPSAAAAAAGRYEHVITGPIEEKLPELRGPFDTIMCLDVLEHLVDPWSVLESLAKITAPDGSLLVSVPNARHWGLLRDIAVRGTFGYGDSGHRDVTHLRWFTRRDLETAINRSGWIVEQVWHGPLHPVSRVLERVTAGLSAELLVHQWYALAHRKSEVTAPQ
jgi:SAM-dependent methyltransferase